MLRIRIIPCLDIKDGQVVKGVKFMNLKSAGDPAELARYYDTQGADEIILLDVTASVESRRVMIDIIEKVSSEVFVPLCVGGGISSLEDIRAILRAGADKVSLCTTALEKPSFIREAAAAFGSQCIVLSIDARREGSIWWAYRRGGREKTGWEAITWAKWGEEHGAGEILLNSIDMDGTQSGYDLELTRRVAENVSIPVIASGGAGSLSQIYEVIVKGKADAVLVASLLHFNHVTIKKIKKYLTHKGVKVR